MTENPTSQTHLDTAPAARLTRKQKRVIALVTTGFLVLVAGTAAVLVPQAIHQSQVTQYHRLVAETTAAKSENLDNEISIQAASELLPLQRQAADDLAKQLNALSTAAAPILSAKTGEMIKSASVELSESLAKLPAVAQEDGTVEGSLGAIHAARLASDKKSADEKIVAIQAKQTKDLAAAKDDAAKKVINDAVAAEISTTRSSGIASSALDLTVDDAASLLELEPAQAKVETVPDAKVTSDIVTQASKARDAALAERDASSQELTKISAQLDELHLAIETMRDPLELAASQAPEQAKAVTAAAPRSGASQQTAMAAAAAAAAAAEIVAPAGADESAKKKVSTETSAKKDVPLSERSVPQLVGLFSAYVSSAKAVSDHHAAVLAEEAAAATAAAAAAAAESGGGSSGGWDEGGWGDGGWSGSSGGGGSSSGGGGGNGGGSSSGGSGGSGNGGGSNGGGGSECDWGCNPTGGNWD